MNKIGSLFYCFNADILTKQTTLAVTSICYDIYKSQFKYMYIHLHAEPLNPILFSHIPAVANESLLQAIET